jgi:subtilisin family serine protease
MREVTKMNKLFYLNIVILSVFIFNIAYSSDFTVANSILVTVRQGSNEGNYFLPLNGQIISRKSKFTNFLEQYRPLTFQKISHRGDRAVYRLSFQNGIGLDNACVALKNIPAVVTAEQEVINETLTEPDDYYYINNFYVPDNMENGIEFYNIHNCVPDSELTYYSWEDEFETNDNWYLPAMQANKAWNIHTGSEEVIIAIIDTGVDWEHPDLSGNIWTNQDEFAGDNDGNGLPGGDGDDDYDGYYNFNDQDISERDFDGDGIDLEGADGVCDAGPDGDYGFGPNGLDDNPPGPGGGDDDTICVDCYDPWDDNLRGPGSVNEGSMPDFDDDMDDIQYALKDDDENGYQEDYRGWNWWTYNISEQNNPNHKRLSIRSRLPWYQYGWYIKR